MQIDLTKLFVLCSERIRRHGSAISRQLAEALDSKSPDELKSTVHKASLSPCLDDSIDNERDPLMQKLVECQDRLPWRYPGFGHLPEPVAKRMAVVELLGPDGIHVAHDIRLGLLVQQARSHYPAHRHAAEELYCILQGTATWLLNGQQLRPTAGSFVHHHPMQTHAMTTQDSPLVALWGWCGDIAGDTYSVVSQPSETALTGVYL